MPADTAPTPELSVVIPVRNGAATIGEQLDALAAQRWDGSWEIVISDNGSTDATPAIAAERAGRDPRLRVVDSSGAAGPSHARNVGARAAAGRALAFCDADDVVGPGWVAAMGGALRTHELVTGPMELARLNPPWLAGSRGSTGTTRPADLEGIPFASSCNLGIVRARLLAVGGFDEALHVGEDIDLSLRLHRLGVPLHFSPGATLHYRYRPTIRATFAQARAYGAARPPLVEAMRRHGEPVSSRGHGARNWAWLVRHAGDLRTRPGRAHWVWVAGQRVGSLEGSWSVRRLYP